MNKNRHFFILTISIILIMSQFASVEAATPISIFSEVLAVIEPGDKNIQDIKRMLARLYPLLSRSKKRLADEYFKKFREDVAELAIYNTIQDDNTLRGKYNELLQCKSKDDIVKEIKTAYPT
jgi:hypothetical protein